MSGFIQIIPVQEKHNEGLKQVIHSVLEEYDANRPGTAFEDESLNNMYSHYQTPTQQYFVVLENGEVIGGAGIGELDDEPGYCELQKMYILSAYRGRGIGYRLMNKCLDFAGKAGYEYCYLETFPHMKKARALYEQKGFVYINKRLGNTSHSACNVFMQKSL